MSALDRSGGPPHVAWLALGRRLAVAAGALTALTALLFHRTLTTAAERGAIAYAAAWVVVRIAGFALARVERDGRAGPKREATRRGR